MQTNDISLGKKIELFRTMYGYTQMDLAELIGRTQATISAWEADRTNMSVSDFEKLKQLDYKKVIFYDDTRSS